MQIGERAKADIGVWSPWGCKVYGESI